MLGFLLALTAAGSVGVYALLSVVAGVGRALGRSGHGRYHASMFEIGNSLREARLRRELELVDAEHGTKIRGKYLRALEDERFELLPAHTYVKGFLRSYADYLGLDGQLYVDEYNSRYRDRRGGRAASRPARPGGEAPPGERRESRVVLVALASIALVTFLVIAAWRFGGPEDEPVRGLTSATSAAAPRS